jgi:hypothetical protein
LHSSHRAHAKNPIPRVSSYGNGNAQVSTAVRDNLNSAGSCDAKNEAYSTIPASTDANCAVGR